MALQSDGNAFKQITSRPWGSKTRVFSTHVTLNIRLYCMKFTDIFILCPYIVHYIVDLYRPFYGSFLFLGACRLH